MEETDGVGLTKQHIDDLRRIDQSVVKLLQSAGSAIESLTRSQTGEGTSDSESIGLEERKRLFTTAASSYFDNLSSIDTGLRREINALATARILPADPNTAELQGQSDKLFAVSPQAPFEPNRPRPQDGRRSQITGGGLGNLDVGRLNSKNDDVGREKESELWDEALRLISSRAVEIDRKVEEVAHDGARTKSTDEDISMMQTGD